MAENAITIAPIIIPDPALHAKWRTTNLLLTLTTACRNGGRSVLRLPSPDERDGTQKLHLEEVVACLLVLNGEVVATISNRLFITHKDSFSDKNRFFHIIAFCNPIKVKNFNKEDKREEDCLILVGKSHLASVDFHEWDSLFTIP